MGTELFQPLAKWVCAFITQCSTGIFEVVKSFLSNFEKLSADTSTVILVLQYSTVEPGTVGLRD